MKLVEAQILNELKNLLCEDVRELVPVAVLEAWPSGYIPIGSKKFAPLGPEGKKQIDSVSDDTILAIHTSQFGAGQDFDNPKIGESLYRDCSACEGTGLECEECDGKGYLGGLTRPQFKELFVYQSKFRPSPKIRKLVKKWQDQIDPEYDKLKEQAAAARDEFNDLLRKDARARASKKDNKADLVDPDDLSQAQAKVEKAYAMVEAYINKYMLNMTRFEMDEVKDDYWAGLRRLAQFKINRNLKHKGVQFKEVDPKSYIKQAVKETLGEYARSYINIAILDQLSGVNFTFNNQGQPIVQSPYPYVKNLFNNTPALVTAYMDFSNQIESKVESGERSGSKAYLSPEEILHFAKLGAFRPSILEKLTSLQISLKGNEVANLERIIREVAEDLEEMGDFASASAEPPPKLKKNAGKLSKKDLSRIADIYDIDDPDLALQQQQREDEKLREYYRQYYEDNQDEGLQESTATPGAIDWDQIPAYAPMDEAPSDEFDVSNLPRQPWDQRRRPSEHEITEDITWIQLAGFDYSGYDKKRSRWEHPFGDTKDGLSGKTEPYHAILEWLWETFLKIKLNPEPYDGFARVPSQNWSEEPGSPSELMFYDSSVPYKYSTVGTEAGTKFRQRNVIYGMEPRGEDETKFSHYAKMGPVAHQVPIPDKIRQTASSPDSMNVEKYNVIFKIENPSLGKTPDKLKNNVDKLISFTYDDLAKRGIVAKIFKDDTLSSTDYELKHDKEGNRLLQVHHSTPFIKVMFYTYRITSDDSDDLLDLTSSDTFWKETEKIRERIRASKIFSNAKTIEELADVVDENPEVFQLNKQTWPANLIRFAIGSGSIEGLDSEGNVVRSSVGKFFTPNQLKNMSDRVVRDASRRKGIDPFGVIPKPTDWDFPVQILKSAIEDLQIIYTQASGDPTTRKAKHELVQHVIDGLNDAINNAAASDEELKRRARSRAQEKEMDWWRKEGLAKDVALKYRRRNEIRHNIVKSKIALSKLMPGVKITDSDLYSYKIFDLVKDMVKQYENLVNQSIEKNEAPIEYWDDRYPYDSFLKVKKGFEHEIISELEENAAERARQLGLSSDEPSLPMIGDQELHPETYSLFTDIEDNPKSHNYGKIRFDLEYGIQPKMSLNGEPITSYQRDQQLDSKEDALVLFYEKLKNIKEQIFSQDQDLMIADLERIIEGLDLQD